MTETEQLQVSQQDILDGWALWARATGYLPSLAFQQACRHDLFGHLEQGPTDAAGLAERAGLDPEAVGLLLECLAAMELVEPWEGGYRNCPAASKMLVHGKPLCQLGIFAHSQVTGATLERAELALKQGHLGAPAIPPGHLEDMMTAMHDAALLAVGRVLPWMQGDRLLDLGGGAGNYSLAFCQSSPDRKAVLLDLPEVAGALTPRVCEARLSERLEVRAQDVRQGDLGQGYTTALVSNLLHYLQSDELEPFLRRVADSLAPGGRLLVRDVVRGDAGTGPLIPALLALRLLTTAPGRGHTLGQVLRAIASSGLSLERVQDLAPEPATLVVARKGSVPACSPPSPRLSPALRPRRYSLQLEIDPEKDDFLGCVEIELEAFESFPHILLHARDLEVDGTTRIDPDLIRVDQLVAPGRSRLRLSYRGKVSRRLRGLYSSQTEEGKKLLVTQGEPNYARLFYPCFDEPAFKATFELTVQIPEGLTAVSNAPEVHREKAGPGRERVRFAATPPMSCYLLALVVGDLEASPPLKVDGVTVRIYATPGKSRLVEYALQVAGRALLDYREYFGCPYPLTKLDLVGVPDFGSGAMENLGCVIFRETNLLAREETSTRDQLMELSLTVTHEIAHQWFGDLVTMFWWDDLWLNEAFATWMMVRAVARQQPDWDCWTWFGGARQRAQELDALESTRPIYAPVESPEQMAEMFDVITYNKGAAVLKMLEEFLGPEVFRRGVAAYIQRHQFANATGADLWEALEEISGQPVRQIMDAWLTRPGYPLVTARREGGELVLRQERFLYSGSRPGTWPIPLVYRVGGEERRLLLCEPEQRVQAPEGPVLLNAGAFGYLRAEPGEVPDPAALSVSERIGLLRDAWALVLSGHWEVERFFELAAAWIPEERNTDVWEAFLDECRDLWRFQWSELPKRLSPLWPRTPCEPDEQRLRARVLAARATLAGDDSQLGWARDFVARPQEKELFQAALQIVSWHGDAGDYARIFSLWQETDEPTVQRQLMLALAGFRPPELVRRCLEQILNAGVRPQDGGHLLLAACKNPAAADTVWSFVRARWEELIAVLPMQGMRLFLQGVPFLVLPERAEEMKRFLTERPVEGGRRQLTQSLECLDIALRLRARLER
ncbi:MAG: hypothetical protein AMXMBFR33_31970 [Candidatus Xenobia bacterium]